MGKFTSVKNGDFDGVLNADVYIDFGEFNLMRREWEMEIYYSNIH